MKDYAATTGTPLADDDGAWNTAGTFLHIALDRITPSLTNPRKTFDPATLAELAASIQASGVHQAVLVRPLPGDRVAETDRAVQFELVTGERRLRACSLANVATIPAMIRPLTDDQVMEIQIVENLQRDDLTELEEAEGYEALMQHSHLGAEFSQDAYARYRASRREYDDGQCDAANALADKIRGVE